MKRIRAALSEIWDGLKLIGVIAGLIAGLYAILINAPVYCRYLTGENATAVIGMIVTAVCIGIVLGVISVVMLHIYRKRRSGIRYRKRRIAGRDRRCLGYPDASQVCDAVRRSR